MSCRAACSAQQGAFQAMRGPWCRMAQGISPCSGFAAASGHALRPRRAVPLLAALGQHSSSADGNAAQSAAEGYRVGVCAAAQPSGGAAVTAAAAMLLLGAVAAEPATAAVHAEPSNALSLPTWAVHTSSVIEWVTAMGLMWRFADVSGNPRWKGMAWGMLPSLGSAMCACTYHFFYNSPDVQFLVALQAGLTVVGNFTCWWAAYRIYQWAQEQRQGA